MSSRMHATRRCRQVRLAVAAPVLAVLPALLLAGCASGGGAPSREPAGTPSNERGSPPPSADPNEVYTRMGLLVNGGDLPFVGRIGYLAGPSPESTTVLLTLSVPAAAISFSREAPQRFEGRYGVDADLMRGGELVHRFSSEEMVRVSSFREATRTDANLVYQEIFRLAPGAHVLTLGVRDAGSTRSGVLRRPIDVPSFESGSLSAPMALLRTGSRTSVAEVPPLVADPRSTYTFGRDSSVFVYVESYGDEGDVPLLLTAYGDGESAIWRDTVELAPLGGTSSLTARTLEVPVSRLGIGVTELSVARLEDGESETSRLPVFVSFGVELPMTSFEQMVGYLRWFTGASRLAALRAADPEDRAQAWKNLLQATDPDPGTPEHEGLQRYFDRISIANERFRGEAAQGWLSDRGRVFVALGEPDMILDSGANVYLQRGQTIAWEYTRFNVRLVFQDVTGFGGWRLMPSLEDDFRAAFAQLHGS